MHPFSKSHQPIRDLKSDEGDIPADATLPGQPSIALHDRAYISHFLEKELYAEDLEKIAPLLWIMATQSSRNINPLTRQRVKGREIVVTEEPQLHLVWIHNRIFIKPLPRYLLSRTFWDMYLDNSRSDIRKAATGFLRTYRHLIQHESDFHIAQQDSLRLIPKDVDWASFSRFTSELGRIEDLDVSGRYCYGELRLTRLNFYAPFFLRRFNFEQVHGQYGDIFSRLYGPILFVFALISIILNSMQVALAAEQIVPIHWISAWSIFRWFSMLSLVAGTVISIWFVGLWLWLFLDEWIYTVGCKLEKKREKRGTSKC